MGAHSLPSEIQEIGLWSNGVSAIAAFDFVGSSLVRRALAVVCARTEKGRGHACCLDAVRALGCELAGGHGIV
jgi:hypothetical protein